MRTNFITISSHRSGSSVFQRWLNQHPKIIARQEDLRGKNIHGENVDKKELYSLLNVIFTSNPDKTAVGFKVQYSHITPELIEYIKQKQIKVIHLIREDVLDIIYWYPGNFEGDIQGGFGPPLLLKSKTTRGKIPEIIKSVNWIKQKREEVKKIADIEITYNQMTNNTNAEWFHDEIKEKEILAFLGVNYIKMKLPQQKADRPALKDCCENYQEIIKVLKNNH